MEAGTDYQAYDADLTTYAAIPPSSDVQTMLGSANDAAIRSNIDAQQNGTDVFLQSRTITNPTTDDDYYWFRAPEITVTAVNCFAQGTSPSITVDVQECDSNGASCSSILSSAITCNGGNDAGTVTDSDTDDNDWNYVALGTPTGTVDAITFTLEGTID